MTIKVLEKTPGCFPQEFLIGDWIDLRTAKDIKLKAPQATVGQKIHWLISPKVRLKRVSYLTKPSRGGIGEGTGKQ